MVKRGKNPLQKDTHTHTKNPNMEVQLDKEKDCSELPQASLSPNEMIAGTLKF